MSEIAQIGKCQQHRDWLQFCLLFKIGRFWHFHFLALSVARYGESIQKGAWKVSEIVQTGKCQQPKINSFSVTLEKLSCFWFLNLLLWHFLALTLFNFDTFQSRFFFQFWHFSIPHTKCFEGQSKKEDFLYPRKAKLVYLWKLSYPHWSQYLAIFFFINLWLL